MLALQKKMDDLDGKGYKALKSIQGTYKGSFFTMFIDYVQGDPFASPSKVRVMVPLNRTDLDVSLFKITHRRIAFEYFFAKTIDGQIKATKNPIRGTGKSGLLMIDAPGQAMIDRTAVNISEEGIEFRIFVGLPARGRTILGKQGKELLCSLIPTIVEKTVNDYDREILQRSIQLSDEQQEIRTYLKENDFIAFVANGSILPRKSGVSQLPLQGNNVIPFQSPSSYEISISLSSGKVIQGMGIPKGISIIVGGGYHGKSTLLQALERGVYNHSLRDGREYVLADDSAVKIRSEDGRSVNDVNISPFINDLPFGKRTDKFSTEDASGSTSQATNIMEALEVDAKVLLIDEDTSATNFMIRDGRMQRLVNKEKEPITPFIDRVRQLFMEKDVSTVLVIGGSGDYFDVADHVIMMDNYIPYDRTREAKEIAEQYETNRIPEKGTVFESESLRELDLKKINKLLDRKEKIDVKGLGTIIIGKSNVYLHNVEQLIDVSQTRAITYILKAVLNDSGKHGNEETVQSLVDKVMTMIDKEGLDFLSHSRDRYPVDLAKPRKYEIAAALNRIRL
ncbi:putative ABC-class ATPase [Evansella vedderi]|uniref:ABC-class ATPase n=1 Tax=Evansella vedderi TaxID=38282 RepID=A0ABT9ZWS1_9BACI|nr:ABC-ATPase domain-containing protein [Evansella vedderi]MDQ0255191.1 putative ABC-class ATPase [Evansella vedderi]